MIISIDKAKQLVNLDGWTNEKIEMKLKAIEQTIRAYTNNNFQDRGFRVSAFVRAGVFMSESLIPFEVGDTVQISGSTYNNGLYTVSAVEDLAFLVQENVRDEDEDLICTKVVYPADVIACAVDMLEWDVANRAKIGIQAETLSRHSVTYFAQTAGNTLSGYPAPILGGLKPYKKVRF